MIIVPWLQQVEYHTEIEERWLPKWLLKRVDKNELIIYPNAVCVKGSPVKSVSVPQVIVILFYPNYLRADQLADFERVS